MLLRGEFIQYRSYSGTEPVLEFGCDPEIELVSDAGVLLRARQILPDWPRKPSRIGCDGSGQQLELRPQPSETAEGLVRNLVPLVTGTLRWAKQQAMFLSVSGHWVSLGFHVHVSWPSEFQVDRARVADAIDRAAGSALQASGAARGRYYQQCAWRAKSYTRRGRSGLEYRSPAGSWLMCPESAQVLINRVASAIAEGHVEVSEFEPWSRWLTEATQQSMIVPVLWSRTWKSEIVAFAETRGLRTPPLKKMPRRAAKRIRFYGEVLQTNWPDVRVVFYDTWSTVMQSELVSAILKLPFFKHVAELQFYGLRQDRGDWLWSVPEKAEINLLGQTVTINLCPGVIPSYGRNIGLSWNMRNIENVSLARALAQELARAIFKYVEREYRGIYRR